MLSLGLATTLPPWFFLTLASFVALTTVHSLCFTHVVLADVIVVASLYTVRVIGGFVATGIGFSAWFLAFSLFLFLSPAFVKRYSELMIVAKAEQAIEEAKQKGANIYAEDAFKKAEESLKKAKVPF